MRTAYQNDPERPHASLEPRQKNQAHLCGIVKRGCLNLSDPVAELCSYERIRAQLGLPGRDPIVGARERDTVTRHQAPDQRAAPNAKSQRGRPDRLPFFRRVSQHDDLADADPKSSNRACIGQAQGKRFAVVRGAALMLFGILAKQKRYRARSAVLEVTPFVIGGQLTLFGVECP